MWNPISAFMFRLRKVLASPWTTVVGLGVCFLILVSGLSDRIRYRRIQVYNRVDRLVPREEFAEASKLLEEYLKDHPSDDYALRLYGMTLLNLGKQDEGHKYYEKSLAINPHQPDLQEYLDNIREWSK